jgi:hypothetical protein
MRIMVKFGHWHLITHQDPVLVMSAEKYNEYADFAVQGYVADLKT